MAYDSSEMMNKSKKQLSKLDILSTFVQNKIENNENK